MDTISDTGYHCLSRAWEKTEEYTAAREWILQFYDFEARWDFEYGRTWLNGVQYPSRVYFRDDKDYLVFKLKFPGLSKW